MAHTKIYKHMQSKGKVSLSRKLSQLQTTSACYTPLTGPCPTQDPNMCNAIQQHPKQQINYASWLGSFACALTPGICEGVQIKLRTPHLMKRPVNMIFLR